MYPQAPLVFVRFFTSKAVLIWLWILVRISVIGYKEDTPLSPWRKKMIAFGCRVYGRVNLVMSGVMIHQFKRGHFDYSKYLGPDWKPTYENASTIVCNHQSFCDILVHMCRQPPSHIAKKGVYNFPLIGFIAHMSGCLFVDRASSDDKKKMFELIRQRQIECEEGKFPPLVIYAEGGTSNGTEILQFKKGAFVG